MPAVRGGRREVGAARGFRNRRRRGSLGALCVLWTGLGTLGGIVAGCGDSTVPTPEVEPTALFAEPPSAIAVDGHVTLFPPSATWLATRGATAAIPAGLSVTFDDPLQRALGDAAAILATTPVAEGGSFAMDAVPVDTLVFGLGAGLEPVEALESAGLADGITTVLFDSLREGMNPREALTGTQVFALPQIWIQALEASVGAAALATRAPDAGSLQEAGFMVGQVIDAAGAPVAGARLEPSPPELADGLYYPTVSLQGHQEATDADGLFLLVHDGGDVRTFTFTLVGEEPTPPHRGVLARERGLLLRIRPPP